MNERTVCCEQCNKELFKTSKTKGAAGAEATNLGYVYKIPFLYGIMDGGHFFCSKECWKNWINANTTKEQREEGDKKAEELRKSVKKDLPKLFKTVEAMKTFVYKNMKR